jgi:exonuclease III
MLIHRNEAAAAAAAAAAATLSFLSLNTNHNYDLAGFAGLFTDIRPDIVCLQEVALPLPALEAVAAGLGLTVWPSSFGRRTIAVLSRLPLTVIDIDPGFCQHISFHSLNLFHFHCPSGGEYRQQRAALFRRCHRLLARFPVPPLLLGDFNCVIDDRDMAVVDPHRRSEDLAALITDLHYFDAFRILHPDRRQYSWHRRRAAAG